MAERLGLGAAARICHRRDKSMSDDQMYIRVMNKYTWLLGLIPRGTHEGLGYQDSLAFGLSVEFSGLDHLPGCIILVGVG